MKRVYLVRYGAYGDHLHMSPVIRAFKEEGWHVTFEYNHKGSQIHAYNPYIDKHCYHEPSAPVYAKDPDANIKLTNRFKEIEKNYDRFVNFKGSLEQSLIVSENSPEYHLPKSIRNRMFGNISFHDQSIKWAGLPEKYHGRVPEVYFRRKEHEHIKKLLRPIVDKGKHIMMWSIAGTMWQKAIYPWAKEVCDEFQRRHPNVVIILTAGPEYKKFGWGVDYKADGWQESPVINVIGIWPFRQALLATRYVHSLVTPETGIGIGAGAYGTPKCMLLTAASLKNIMGGHKNDFSIQSDAWCSPCHRAIYNMDTCDTKEVKDAVCSYSETKHSDRLPICVFFDKEKVLDQMEKMYECGWEPDYSEVQEEVYV